MKKRILASVLGLSLCLLPSCLGPNKLTNKLNNWNGAATEMNWLNEVIFIPLIPVYSFTQLADILVVNVFDYWGDGILEPAGTFPESFSSK